MTSASSLAAQARDFRQSDWDAQIEDDCRQIVRLAVREELDRAFDWTTVVLVPSDARGEARLVARQPGVIAGLRPAAVAIDEMQVDVQWSAQVEEGALVERGQCVAVVRGSARDLLTTERTVLNILCRLSGIATNTRRYVDRLAGSRAKLYDTRKTTPGWRRLEKYAVRRGGGHNHRTGLFDAILIKDNHLAVGQPADAPPRYSPAEAVRRAKQFLADQPTVLSEGRPLLIEIEVDTLEQLAQVLPAGPDIVLLDNMPPAVLREAVALRDRLAPHVELEASGGITLDTIADVGATGVDRISCGALTHSAINFDIGLDWV